MRPDDPGDLPPATAPRVLIVGLGNDLAADEGLGPHAIRRLAERGLPGGVEAIDARTDLLAVADEMARAGRVILIDAVQAGGPPGTIYRWAIGDLVDRAARGATPLSGHGLALIGAVDLLRATGVRLPPMILYGVEPLAVAFGMDLTAEVASAMEEMIDRILGEVTDRRGRS
jgi:hydrogenase maturation protease